MENETEKTNEIIRAITSKTLTTKQIEIILHQIPDLLDINEYEAAIYINETVKKRDKNNIFTRMTNFYDKLIKELKEINELDNPQKEICLKCIEKGKSQYRNKQIGAALYTFEYGLEKTNIKLFHYYIGKALYEIAHYDRALPHLFFYAEEGAYKLFNCKHYLSKILIKPFYNKTGKAIHFAKDAEYYSHLLNQSYKTKLTYAFSPEDKNTDKLHKMIPITEEFFNEPNTFQQERLKKKRRKQIPKKRRKECQN